MQQDDHKSNDLQNNTNTAQSTSILTKAATALFGYKQPRITKTMQTKVVQPSAETFRTPYSHPWCKKKAPCYGTFDTKTFMSR